MKLNNLVIKKKIYEIWEIKDLVCYLLIVYAYVNMDVVYLETNIEMDWFTFWYTIVKSLQI